jgi:hypothetical protein
MQSRERREIWGVGHPGGGRDTSCCFNFGGITEPRTANKHSRPGRKETSAVDWYHTASTGVTVLSPYQ